MKLKSKLMAAAIALVAASGANATVTNSGAGNGELFFTIYDQGADLSSTADDRAYVRDLGSLLSGGTMNDWVSATTTAPLAALNANKQGFGTIYSVGADANLTSFLAASTDTSRLKWNIAAGDANGTDRIMTTATSIALAQTPALTQFRGLASKVDLYLPYVNNAGIPDAGSINLTGVGSGIGAWGNNFGGGSAFTNTAGLNDSLNFFVLSERVATGSTTTKADVRQFMADSTTAMEWTLAANGNLTYGAVAAIPEPSEYALMLAGLGMLGFMARRLNNRA